MPETWEKVNGDLAVTVRVTEQVLLNELAHQERRKARALAEIVILEDKLAVINAR